MKWILILFLAAAGCGKAQGDGTQIVPMTALDGSQCLVVMYNGEPRGLSCR